MSHITIEDDEDVSNLDIVQLKEQLKRRGYEFDGVEKNLLEKLNAVLLLENVKDEESDCAGVEPEENKIDKENVAFNLDDPSLLEDEENSSDLEGKWNSGNDSQVGKKDGIIIEFKDVEDTIRTFSGDDHTIIISHWLKNFEETSKICEWSDIQKLVYAKKLLKGSAKLFIMHKRNITSWNVLKNALLKEFTIKLSSKMVHKELANRKKRKDETYQEYMYAMLDIGAQCNVEKKSMIQYIIDGISDTEVNKSILYGIPSLKEFRNKMRVYEATKVTKIKDKDESKKKSGNKKIKKKKKVEINVAAAVCCSVCEENSHTADKCPNRIKGPKCSKCHKFGHTSANCLPNNSNKQVQSNSLNTISSHDNSVNSNIKYHQSPPIKIDESDKESPKNELIKNEDKPEVKDAQTVRKKYCFLCGVNSHIVDKCPKRNKGPKCFKCHQFGHIAPNCLKNNSKIGSQSKTASLTNNTETQSKPVCLTNNSNIGAQSKPACMMDNSNIVELQSKPACLTGNSNIGSQSNTVCMMDNSNIGLQSKPACLTDNTNKRSQSKPACMIDNSNIGLQSMPICLTNNSNIGSQSQPACMMDNSNIGLQSKPACLTDNTNKGSQSKPACLTNNSNIGTQSKPACMMDNSNIGLQSKPACLTGNSNIGSQSMPVCFTNNSNIGSQSKPACLTNNSFIRSQSMPVCLPNNSNLGSQSIPVNVISSYEKFFNSNINRQPIGQLVVNHHQYQMLDDARIKANLFRWHMMMCTLNLKNPYY